MNTTTPPCEDPAADVAGMLPPAIRDLTLDLTGLAGTVVIAGGIRPVIRESGEAVRPDQAQAVVEAWCTLTGLTEDAALDVARQIVAYGPAVSAVVVPF